MSAGGEILLLTERSADSRVAIAEAGAIPLLVGLLSTPDSRTQEHAVTALLNLSICEDDIGSIISCGAVPGLFMCSSTVTWKHGKMQRQPFSAFLFVDENKVRVGKVLKGGRRNEALAILAVLARHSEGKAAEAAEAVPLLVEASETGSLQNKEIIAAAVLVHLFLWRPTTFSACSGTRSDGFIIGFGTKWPERGKRKAAQFLAGMTRFTERNMC